MAKAPAKSGSGKGPGKKDCPKKGPMRQGMPAEEDMGKRGGRKTK